MPTAPTSRVLAAVCTTALALAAQGSGSRGGVATPPTALTPLTAPDADTLERVITLRGRAEVRVTPTELRVVLAVVSEEPTAAQAHATQTERLAALRARLETEGIAGAAVHTDFIAMLPVYDWRVEKLGGRDHAVEFLAAQRTQDNVHVSVPDEATARRAVGAAFELGITDVIAFDYGAQGLEGHKQRALQQALDAARRKADLLLGLFEQRPRLLNVQEDTRTLYPRDLYRSFETAYQANYQAAPYRDNQLPSVAAPRPKNTFYEGFAGDVDASADRLPTSPEISVVATVALHFAPPRPEPAPASEGR